MRVGLLKSTYVSLVPPLVIFSPNVKGGKIHFRSGVVSFHRSLCNYWLFMIHLNLSFCIFFYVVEYLCIPGRAWEVRKVRIRKSEEAVPGRGEVGTGIRSVRRRRTGEEGCVVGDR